jgi:dTDP-glucose 4,6-dehydratase
MNYVTDTVEGFIAIGCREGIAGETINIGSGQEVAIRSLVERVGKILSKKLEVKPEEKRVRPEASEVARLVADNRKAKKLLGWEPKVSLDEGLNKTIEWFRAKRTLFATQVREYQI